MSQKQPINNKNIRGVGEDREFVFEELGIQGSHSILSPSQYHWLSYDADKMRDVYFNREYVLRGTKMHEIASDLIRARWRLAPLKKAVNLFVNDAIAMNMSSEVTLIYSQNAFGTADAIKFDLKTNTLHIHDLKTGKSKPSFNQLVIYAALFCHQYGYSPNKINFVLRLYQGRDYKEVNSFDDEGLKEEIRFAMDKIVELDAAINRASIDIRDEKFW